MLKKIFQRISYYLWSPSFILLILCCIFYACLQFFANNALENAPKVTIALVDKILALRMLLCVIFCLILGYLGVKLTGHIWPAMLIHTLVVTGLLLIDLPLSQVITHWNITLLIISTVAAITGISGAITLAYFWIRMHKPAFFKRKK